MTSNGPDGAIDLSNGATLPTGELANVGDIAGSGIVTTTGLTNTGQVCAFTGGSCQVNTAPSTLTVDGDYSQTNPGNLNADFDGATAGQHSTLAVTGTADLGGILTVVTDGHRTVGSPSPLADRRLPHRGVRPGRLDRALVGAGPERRLLEPHRGDGESGERPGQPAQGHRYQPGLGPGGRGDHRHRDRDRLHRGHRRLLLRCGRQPRSGDRGGHIPDGRLAPGTGIADVQVLTASGNSQIVMADQFSYGPVVTGLTPDSGSPFGGNTVTIAGGGFEGVPTVDFGATPATGVVVDSPSSITATAPAGSGTVHVTVHPGFRTSPTSSADQYRYGLRVVFNPPLSSLSMAAGSTTAAITVELEDLNGNATPAPAGGQTLSLVSTSAVGTFFENGQDTAVTSIVVPAGQSTVSFQYSDTVAGSPTITVGGAQAPAFVEASLPVTVNAGPLANLVVSPASVTVAVGGQETFTAEGFDAYNNDLGQLDVDGRMVDQPVERRLVVYRSDLHGGGGRAHTVTATVGGINATAALVGDVAAGAVARRSHRSVYTGSGATFPVVGHRRRRTPLLHHHLRGRVVGLGVAAGGRDHRRPHATARPVPTRWCWT